MTYSANGFPERLRILLVEDSPLDAEILLHEMKRAGFDVEHRRVQTQPELEEALRLGYRGLRPLRIAVNVSAIQLRQGNFADMVRQAINEFPDAPHGLDLEITESMIMDGIEGNIEKLRALRAIGANIAIDDFGTGYSSLGYLAKLPVNALKIDRSFIMTMDDSPDSMTIVTTIISLAHALNLKVIAEGVESREQWNLLNLLKCDELQGYVFSRPLPSGDVESMFDRG